MDTSAACKGIVSLGWVAGARTPQQLGDVRNRYRCNTLADQSPAAIVEVREPKILRVPTLPAFVVFCHMFKRASVPNRTVEASLDVGRDSDSFAAQAL